MLLLTLLAGLGLLGRARAQVAVNTTVLSSSAACSYTGNWLVGADHQSLTAGDTVSCTFTGTAVYFVAQICAFPTACVPAASGSASFDIDGGLLSQEFVTPVPLAVPAGSTNGYATVICAQESRTGLLTAHTYADGAGNLDPTVPHTIRAQNLQSTRVLWFQHLLVTQVDLTAIPSVSSSAVLSSVAAPASSSSVIIASSSPGTLTSTAAPTSSTAAVTDSQSNSSNSSKSGGSHAGAIAGGVVGGVAALALIVLAICCVQRRARRSYASKGSRLPDSPSHGSDPWQGGVSAGAAWEKPTDGEAHEMQASPRMAQAAHNSHLPYLDEPDTSEAAAANGTAQQIDVKRSIKRKPVPRSQLIDYATPPAPH